MNLVGKEKTSYVPISFSELQSFPKKSVSPNYSYECGEIRRRKHTAVAQITTEREPTTLALSTTYIVKPNAQSTVLNTFVCSSDGMDFVCTSEKMLMLDQSFLPPMETLRSTTREGHSHTPSIGTLSHHCQLLECYCKQQSLT